MVVQTYSPAGFFKTLENYIIGREKHNHNNTFLKDAVIANDLTEYNKLIQNGYNPYRKDADNKMPFEYSADLKYFEASHEWIGLLAFDMNPDIESQDDEDDITERT